VDKNGENGWMKMAKMGGWKWRK